MNKTQDTNQWKNKDLIFVQFSGQPMVAHDDDDDQS